MGLVKKIGHLEKLPVVNFAAGGIAMPADASLMVQLGADGIFVVGSGIFKSSNPKKRAEAIVAATTYFDDPKILAKISEDLGEEMQGIDIRDLSEKDKMQVRSE